MGAPLPPGQRAIEDFPRFGLPLFATRWPAVASRPVLEIQGDVEVACELTLAELAELPRVEQESDFHCVTTWTRRGVRWSGYRLRDVYERVLVRGARPHPAVRYVRLRGLDGYGAVLDLEDALGADVLLADRLDGEVLPLEHGAPIRLVAPALYGYKSVKHLCRIEVSRERHPGAFESMIHPRGRVELEERGKLPGWVLRRLYRATLPYVLWKFRRAARPREIA